MDLQGNYKLEGLLHFLDLKKIAVSTGAACNSKVTQISHVLSAIHLPRALARGTIRVTFGAENSEEDVVTIVRAIVKYCSMFTVSG